MTELLLCWDHENIKRSPRIISGDVLPIDIESINVIGQGTGETSIGTQTGTGEEKSF